MTPSQKTKERNEPDSVAGLLNYALAGALDLKLQAKQAHWNVRGANFIALHELFDKLAADADEYADLLAERAVQLGSAAQGTAQDIAARSPLPPYPAGAKDAAGHVRALENAVGKLSVQVKRGIDDATALQDAVTADLLTEIARGLDKWRWLVAAHNG